MTKEKLEAPKEIYLQYVDYLEDSWDEFDFTWCEDRIDESDVRYIRFDIVDDLLTAKETPMKLIYSPDDNGYYWQRYVDWKVSQLFSTIADANRAKNNGLIIWS